MTSSDFNRLQFHCGWHPDHVHSLLNNTQWPEFAKEFHKAWLTVKATRGDKERYVIWIFCRQGFHRSVALSRILQETWQDGWVKATHTYIQFVSPPSPPCHVTHTNTQTYSHTHKHTQTHTLTGFAFGINKALAEETDLRWIGSDL